jgi:predicted ATPase
VRLLERQRELDVLREGLHQVRGGQGAGFALAGDSGTGKSSTIAAALFEVTGLRVMRGHCDPLRTPRPLGPFRELGLPGLSALASIEETRLTETAEAALADLGSEPTVLVIEDLHWADAASTDVLRYLVRRIETVPLAILLSYRDLEIGPRHPARRLLGDFASSDGLRTLVLQPLSVDAVAEAVQGTDLDPVRVHRLTGGNPFYVSQVALEPDRPLPDSVRDTVLARVAGVEPGDLEVLQLIACSPDRLDDRVLPLVGVDLDTLRRLGETTLLTYADHGIAFRHELARQAVASTIPPGGAPRLHQQLMQSLEQLEPRDPATLTHHALAARDAERTLTYSCAAAGDPAPGRPGSRRRGYRR